MALSAVKHITECTSTIVYTLYYVGKNIVYENIVAQAIFI